MTEGDDLEPPREWVEELLANEESIRDVLDGIRERQLLGDHETVRERLRSLAETRSGIFRTVTLATLGMEAFYDDLRDQYGEDESPPIETLETFGERYDPLSSEFEVAFLESLHGYRNPSPTVARGFRYSESTGMPRLAFDVYSGDLELCEFDHPPSQALTLAGLVVDGVGDLLERTVANGDDISEAELDRAASVCQQLESDVEDVLDQLEEVTVVTEESDDDGQGWSFSEPGWE